VGADKDDEGDININVRGDHYLQRHVVVVVYIQR